MSSPIIITLSLPSPEMLKQLHAGGGHWRARSAPTAKARDAAHVAALVAMATNGIDRPLWPSGKVTLHFHWDFRSKGRSTYPDKWNAVAACKASIDGICDAGVYANDRDVVPVFGSWTIDQDNPRLELHCEGPEGSA